MALVFAVFLLALLAAFARPDGRAQRIARLKDIIARAGKMARAVRMTGGDTVDRIAAELADDHRSAGGVGRLLTPADGSRGEPLQQRARS
jgi:hypothetical protein